MISGLLIGLLAAAPAPGTAPAPSQEKLARFEYAQVHMGTRFRIVLYAADREVANAGAQAAFKRIEALDGALSDYNPKSELSRLSSASPTAEPVRVSNDLWPVLCRAQRLAQQTGGAFDITAGPLTSLWRKSRNLGRLSSPAELAAARRSVGYEKLKLDAEKQAARLLAADMRLDLGGIAKGFAADEALRVLADRGVTRVLVAAGGDIVVGDPPPGRRGWNVAIAPLRRDDGAIMVRELTLVLHHAAVSTSGDSEQHLEIGGVRYSHIVDPRTGLGLTTRTYVTVVAADGMTSDSLATAASVLGPKEGMKLLRAVPGVEGRIVLAKGDQVETMGTPGFGK